MANYGLRLTTIGLISTLSAHIALANEELASTRNTLDSDSAQLESVRVTGSAEPLAEISTKKLLRVPGAGYDALQAIESLPGITFVGGIAKPAVRGSSPDDNQYLIDFLPVGYIFHSDSSSLLNDNVIDDFVLETAAFSPQYNNAIGAVIDASSRAPYYDQSQFIVDASLLRAGVFFETPINEDHSVYFSARQSLFQYYIEAFLDSDDFEFTTVPEFYDYQAKYQYRINDTDRLTVQAIGARDKAGIIFADDSDQVQQDPALSGGLNFEQYFNSQGVVWDKFYSSGMTHKIALSQLEQAFQFQIGALNRVDVKTNDYILRSQFNYPLNFEHELQWGIEYRQSHIGYVGEFSGPACDEFTPDCRLSSGTETLTGSGKPRINRIDGHVADIWDVTPSWQLTTGVALAYDDYTEQTFVEPRLRSRWEFHRDWWLTAAYGQHHILPDNFGTYIPVFGNRDLKQPTADHYELGLEHQLSDTQLVQLEVYYKQLDNIIIARPSPGQLPDLSEAEYTALYGTAPRYTNDADGYAWGMELFYNQNLSERWYGWVSVAYSRTFRTNQLTQERFTYNFDQPVIINAVANYQLNANWDIGFKWRYQSGQLVTPLLDAEFNNDTGLYDPIYGRINSERLPDFHKLDVRADRSFRFDGWDMDLYVEILNVYARDNVIGYSYKNADYSEREDVTDLPTIASVGIKARF